jgi:hypothetical protein
MRRPCWLVLVPLMGNAACAPPAPPRPALGTPIDTMALRRHGAYLASDLLEGRGTGTRGAAVAAAYLGAQCRALGLEPLGPRYLMDVPLEEARIRLDEAVVRIARGGDTTELRAGDDFLAVGGTRAALGRFTGRLVYVGTDDEIRAAATLPPLTDAVAVTGGAIRTDVATRLREGGAVGVVQLTGSAEGYALYRASRGLAMILHADPGITSSFHPPLPALVLAPHAAPALVAAVRDGGMLDARLTFDQRPIHAWNVGCVLPGRDARLRDSLIALTAHYDHLGFSVPDEHGDSLYNGFSDNAAGVAMLLAIAQAVRATPDGALRHSLVVLFFTGEERGLLGSDYFVTRPPVPLERFRAVINLDAGAPPARPWSWRVAGGSGTALGALAADVAAERGWSATLSPPSANSDYFPFLDRGVPAVFLIPGSAPYEGLSADSSQALRRRWDRYHQAGDEYHEAFPFEGLRRYATYALLLVEAVDRGRLRREP